MITMSTKQQIILRYFREGQSQRQIARELHISRLTVRKYIAAYSQSQASIRGSQGKVDEQLIEEIVASPTYDSSNRSKRKLIEELASRIDEFLQENDRKRQAGLHKQVMKKTVAARLISMKHCFQKAIRSAIPAYAITSGVKLIKPERPIYDRCMSQVQSVNLIGGR